MQIGQNNKLGFGNLIITASSEKIQSGVNGLQEVTDFVRKNISASGNVESVTKISGDAMDKVFLVSGTLEEETKILQKCLRENCVILQEQRDHTAKEIYKAAIKNVFGSVNILRERK